MEIGLQLPSFTWPGGPLQIRDHLAEIAQMADQTGFASLWVMDHFFQIEMVGPASDPMLESYSTLSFLAGLTHTVQLGTLVGGVVYRHPGVLVKTVSTLDVLSCGRAYLGIGAAWYEREAAGLGIPFPGWSERFERLEETLQIAKKMWSGDVGTYQGKHFSLAETMNQPQPLSRPHPPILIGGMGEKKTLRLVAQYGDACNFVLHVGFPELRRKLDVLKRHCDEAGRPFEEIERTILGGIHLADGQMTTADLIQLCQDLAGLGFQHLIINMPNVHEITPVEVIGSEVIPAVADY